MYLPFACCSLLNLFVQRCSTHRIKPWICVFDCLLITGSEWCIVLNCFVMWCYVHLCGNVFCMVISGSLDWWTLISWPVVFSYRCSNAPFRTCDLIAYRELMPMYWYELICVVLLFSLLPCTFWFSFIKCSGFNTPEWVHDMMSGLKAWRTGMCYSVLCCRLMSCTILFSFKL